MKKHFKFNIPDEIWVDNFSKKLTSSAIYEGPETLYVLVDGNSIISWSEENYEFYDRTNRKVVTLDANFYPDIAHMLSAVDSEKEYEDEINSDGSVYQKIKNPSMRDYYDLKYYDDVESDNPWKLILIVKNRTVPDTLRVKSELEIAENHKINSTFNAEIVSLLDKYILEAKQYLESTENYYPWKYTDISFPKGPNIPKALSTAFEKIVIENPTE